MLKRLSIGALLLLLLLITPSYADLGRRGGGGAGAACVVMVNLAQGDDNFEFWQAQKAVTLVDVSCYCRGTCTGVATLTFQDRATNPITLTTTPLTCGSGASDSVYTTFDTADSDRLLNAGEGLKLNVTNVPNPDGADEYTVCARYL